MLAGLAGAKLVAVFAFNVPFVLLTANFISRYWLAVMVNRYVRDTTTVEPLLCNTVVILLFASFVPLIAGHK